MGLAFKLEINCNHPSFGEDQFTACDEVARILTGDPAATAADGAVWLRELRDALQIPSLGAFGMSAADVPLVVEKASAASSMQANPIKLTAAELAQVLRAAL